MYPRGSGDLAFAPTPLAAMFAYSPDRHAVNPHSHQSTDGARRFVRTGVTQPGSPPLPAPTLPLSAPSEPDHERAYPQADGEP